MTREELEVSLENMLNDKKAIPFLNHIVRSYCPEEKVSPILVKPEGGFKCCLTLVDLDLTNSVTGADTTTHMTKDAFGIFYEWVLAKAFEGNKHICWLLNNISRDSILTRAIKNGTIPPKKVIKRSHSSTFALGDVNEKLAKLKASMEAQENK